MIRHCHDSEKPRERCLAGGAECLSLRECLALLLGSGPRGEGCMGLSARILERSGSARIYDARFNDVGFGDAGANDARALFTALESSGLGFLQNIKGLGPAGKGRILAAFELARRYAVLKARAATGSEENERHLGVLARKAVQKIPDGLRSAPREWLGFVGVTGTGAVMDLCVVERGVRTHVNVDPAAFFARLLALRPAAFFMAHNHPSGSLLPSQEDQLLTVKMETLAAEFGIRFLGHAIVTAQAVKWID
ncbi:MAG: hypothetical protein HYW49_02380 [Deltaproteobacteria bacterium]|nr:hypothetical protein [Deltaproteobacteria bacterium]